MPDDHGGRRVVEINGSPIAPPEPKPRKLRPAKLSDFPGVPEVYLQVASKLSNPLLMGSPICEELVNFVRHLFTEEEADLVRHLSVFKGRSAEDLARAVHRSVKEVQPILYRVAIEKRAIACTGPDDARKYKLTALSSRSRWGLSLV